MSEVSADSLFHYTPSKEGLLGILQNGFRMSYCFEDFDEETSHFNDDSYIPMGRIIGSKEPRYGIAIPMVCFCDIPLYQTREHREYYGNYCVGLDKEAFFKQYRAVINPVFYYYEESWTKDILPRLVSIKKKWGKKVGVNVALHSIDYCELQFYIREIISLAKPYSGLDTEGRFKRFYDEREWRITFNPVDDKHSPDLKYGLLLKDFREKKVQFNQELSNIFLKLNEGTAKDIISHIIVPKERDIPVVANYISESTIIMGERTSDNEKQLLTSKLTSFERIENSNYLTI